MGATLAGDEMGNDWVGHSVKLFKTSLNEPGPSQRGIAFEFHETEMELVSSEFLFSCLAQSAKSVYPLSLHAHHFSSQ